MAVLQQLTPKLTVIVLYLLTVTKASYNTEVSYQAFKQAVLHSYNRNRSLDDNFYSLLGIICPESVFCAGKDSGAERNEQEQIPSTGTDWFINTTDFTNNSLTQITEARNILAENSHRLKGCCKPCSCRDDCSEKNNCCPEFLKKHGRDQNIAESNVKQECLPATIKAYVGHTAVGLSEKRMVKSYFMVADCFSPNVSIETLTKCRHPSAEVFDQITPVYSNKTGRTYRNVFCARCNKDVNLTSWQIRFTLSTLFTLNGKYKIPSTPEKLLKFILENLRMTDMIFIPSNPLLAKEEVISCTKYVDIIYECNPAVSQNNDTHNFFQSLCSKYESEYTRSLRTYGNVFCQLCSSKHFYVLPKPECTVDLSRSLSKSFSAILTIDERDTSQAKEPYIGNGPCRCIEYFDHTKGECLELICPPGYMFHACNCKPFIENMSRLQVILHTEISPTSSTNFVFNDLASSSADAFITDILSAVTYTMKRRWKSIYTKHLAIFIKTWSREAKTNVPRFQMVSLIWVRYGYDTHHELKSLHEALQNGIEINTEKSRMILSIGTPNDLYYDKSKGQFVVAQKNLSLHLHNVSENMLSMSYQDYRALKFTHELQGTQGMQILSKLLFCKRVMLSNDDIATLQNLTTDTGYTGLHLKYIYEASDSSMCLDEYEHIFVLYSSAAASTGNYIKYVFLFGIALLI